jgi:Prokaryotic E2 family E
MAKFLPSADSEYLESKGYMYEEAEEDGKKALILKAFKIPGDRLDSSVADILIFLPSGYPDVAPDMFHTNPWLKLVSRGIYPNRADQPIIFAGISWQRWSRHSTEWRAGIDGIHTMLVRVGHALVSAAA